jgi:hypothetical protein
MRRCMQHEYVSFFVSWKYYVTSWIFFSLYTHICPSFYFRYSFF